LDSINETVVVVSMEYAAVEIDESPTIILVVTGVSRRRLFFNFQNEFDTLSRLLGTLLKAGNDDVTYAGDFDIDRFIKELDSRNSLLETAIGIVPKMDVDNTQSSLFNLLENSCEQCLCGPIPLLDKGFDVFLLDYERIIVW
jgi:hypothetical protein